MIKKWDIALIAALLLLSLIPEAAFFFSSSARDERTYAVVQVDGKEYKTISLAGHQGTDSFTIQTERGYNTVVVQEQSIGIVAADCPDKVCVGEGFISRPGATTVCLPHKVLIEVRAERNGDPDIIPAH